MSSTEEDRIVQARLASLISDARFQLVPEKTKKPIARLVFSLMSSDEIRSMSVGEITQTRLALNSNQEGSLYSLLMGPYDSKSKCQECKLGEDACMGHFSHIELPKGVAIINPSLLPHVCKLLNLTCVYCGNCCIMDFQLRKNKETGFKRFEQLASEMPSKKMNLCGHCRQSKYHYYVNGYDIYKCDPTNKRETEMFVDPLDIEVILKQISNETLQKLGFHIDQSFRPADKETIGLIPNSKWVSHANNRPEWTVMTCIPVMPTCDRAPSNVGGIIRHDDMTDKYAAIYRTCCDLAKVIEAGEDRKELYARLQEHYATLIDNTKEISRYQNNNRPHFTINNRFKGKLGYFRTNAQGKRTNYGARSVITAEVNMSIDECRVPAYIANIVTVPELVTETSRSRLTELAINGQIHMINIGKRLVSAKVLTEKMKACGQAIELEIGWRVHRVMQDGDIVIANREPTLHRQNLLALKTIVGGPDSIGMHPSIISGFNGDKQIIVTNRQLPISHGVNSVTA